MTIPVCPTCAAELGPWEAANCLSHPRPTEYDWIYEFAQPSWSIAEYAVLALEHEPSVVSIYDIRRAIAREFGREVQPVSLTALVGTDRRFCWSGKGLYGLFRHDRIPGERTLSGVSRFVLAAYGDPILISDLTFVLKWSGYRFQDTSLENALGRDARHFGFRFSNTGYPDWTTMVGLEEPAAARQQLALSLAIDDPYNGPWPGETFVAQWTEKVSRGIEERYRRLGSTSPSEGMA